MSLPGVVQGSSSTSEIWIAACLQNGDSAKPKRMAIELKLNNLAARLALLVVALGVSALLLMLIVANFITGTLTDDRAQVRREVLASAVDYFPDSPRLQGRLAEAELFERERDLARAEAAIETAIKLSPYDHSYRLTLAAIKEAQRDRDAAEQALREGLELAPNNADAHWRLANVLVRQGKLDESLEEFRIATSANGSLLAGTLDLLWQVSAGRPDALEAATGGDPKDRLMLARFLLRKGRLLESAEVFRGLSRSARLINTESGTFLNELISTGGLETAKALWVDLKGGDPAAAYAALIWNGGFESDILRDFSQFDWSITRSEYARLSLDTSTVHSGMRSLRIDFIGRDTTRLSGEIKQLVVVRPGVRYQLECYVKTGDLVTPEAPRVLVADRSSAELAVSQPISSGSTDWGRVAVEFTAPSSSDGAAAIYVMLQRIPKYAYDDPTRGTIWLDDFALKVAGK